MSEKDREVMVERDVAVPMRDGTILRADVTRPADSGRYPVLLQRTPYDKRRPETFVAAKVVAARGYVVISQDTRGRFASEGEFVPYRNDAQDGHDTILWAARQTWSNGKVGGYGGSYMGATQLLAAATSPELLVCLFPAITGQDHYDGWIYQGGALNLSNRIGWVIMMAADLAQRKGTSITPQMKALLAEMARTIELRVKGDLDGLAQNTRRIGELLDAWYRHLPLKEAPIPRELAAYFFDWMDHSTAGEFWEPLNVGNRLGAIRTPAFHLGGWYDLFARVTFLNYNSLREQAGTLEARRGQRLMVGPWTHGAFTSQAGEMSFGPQANLTITDITNLHLQWFDYWLKGEANDVLDGPPIRLFVMGRNVWRDENEWPLARTRFVRYYAHSAGRANSLHGNGRLDPAPPGDEPPDSFVYDPANPVPTTGGNILPIGQVAGVRDQRSVEAREDVLVYTSDILQEDVEVTGPLAVDLWAASSAPDTDFTAKLVDVHPNGYAQNIQDGIIRARFRESLREPRPIKPGEVLAYRIDLSVTSNVFLAGHRIRLEISSSNFPHYDRNPNTGHGFGEDAGIQVAWQTIFHDRAHPTCIILPVIPFS